MASSEAGARKRVDPETVRVTFDDVAGIDEVEAEINEIVDFLKDPRKYQRLGARAPKGVLLSGPPGTGKTLLARATAGEAHVPFFSASASEFIEMIVGVGASRVRELFGEARKVAPAIIFIDEIDTIGRTRAGARSFGGHDEREQTLNQILTEMDGFSGHEGVIVLAATNRPDVLDPALLRPGRFDRTIIVHPPDQEGRVAILRVHTRKVPLAPDVNLHQLAASTPGMTGADLANLVNEAALLAARRGHSKSSPSATLPTRWKRYNWGRPGTSSSRRRSPARTAYHEAGHALIGMLQPGADPVRKVSIIPARPRSGCDAVYAGDRSLRLRREVPARAHHRRAGRHGGRAGGLRCHYDRRRTGSRGGHADRALHGRSLGHVVACRQAVPYCRRMAIRAWRVSRTDMLNAIDEEVRRITDECYAEARRLLKSNRDKLDAIVKELLVRETLDEPDVYRAAGIARPVAEGGAIARAAATMPSSQG